MKLNLKLCPTHASRGHTITLYLDKRSVHHYMSGWPNNGLTLIEVMVQVVDSATSPESNHLKTIGTHRRLDSLIQSVLNFNFKS